MKTKFAIIGFAVGFVLYVGSVVYKLSRSNRSSSFRTRKIISLMQSQDLAFHGFCYGVDRVSSQHRRQVAPGVADMTRDYEGMGVFSADCRTQIRANPLLKKAKRAQLRLNNSRAAALRLATADALSAG